MQLDLFEDNRANILLNIADEYLRKGEFVKALSTCKQVRDEYPENRQASQLCGLQGIFPLPLQHPPALDELEEQAAGNTTPTARLWYGALTIAELLRTVQRDDRQMAAVRRLMKQLNEDMFECYM
jgi:hypothetical protein